METKNNLHRITKYQKLKNMKNILYTLILGLALSLLSHTVSAQTKVSDTQFVQKYDALIYPNPVTENNFYVKSDQTIRTVEVINMIGQSIRRVENETGLPYNILVRLPECDKGLYMIKITYEDRKTQIKKILVK